MSLAKFLLKNVDLKGKDVYGTIYKITNQINNKKYIGKTTNKNKCRWDGTLEGARIYNKHLQNSMNKYNVENFKIDVIDTAKDKEELNEKEIHWIFFYNTTKQNYGYNKTYGGDGGKPTKETIKKLKKSLEEFWKKPERRKAKSEEVKTSWTPERRKKHIKPWTPERRKAKSEEVKTSWTPEKRKKQSVKMRKKWQENNPMKNPEIVEKMKKTREKTELIKIQKNYKSKCNNLGHLFYWLKSRRGIN